PRAPIGRIFFLAVSSHGLQWTFFPGPLPLQTYCWAALFLITSTVAFPLCVLATLSFPEETAPSPMPRWPWVLAAFGPAAFTWVFATPLPPCLGQPVAFAVNVAAIATVLAIVTSNFIHAGPIGRRQLK